MTAEATWRTFGDDSMSVAEQVVLDVLCLWKAVIRHPRHGERIPPEFDIGFDKLERLDTDWVWVTDIGGKI